MCEFQESNCNGLGDIWWTDKCIYFSSIDSTTAMQFHMEELDPYVCDMCSTDFSEEPFLDYPLRRQARQNLRIPVIN